jgi:hypothetical protein
MIWILAFIVWYLFGVLGCYIVNRFSAFEKLSRRDVVAISIFGPITFLVTICFAIFDRDWWNKNAF